MAFWIKKISIDKIVVSDKENHGAEIEKIQIEYKKRLDTLKKKESSGLAQLEQSRT